MRYLKGWYFCSDSNWGTSFDSGHRVSVETHEDFKHGSVECDDWKRLIIMKSAINKVRYDMYARLNPEWTDSELIRLAVEEFPTLRSEVFQWLRENVADSTDINRKDRPEGWCIGDTQRRMKEMVELNIWFLRRRDALKFIKTWSVHKQPTETFSDDIKKVLIDGKLVEIER